MNSMSLPKSLGLPNAKERRQMLESAIAEHPMLSSRWLAECLGVFDATVRRYRNNMSNARQAAQQRTTNNPMNCYKKYSLHELRLLANATEPTPVNLILDRETIDFLLGLNTNNRTLSQRVVDSFLHSYDKIGWKCTETLCVTNDSTLGNGQHRLTGLKKRDYPKGIFATVVFGVDRESMLVIDQHSKRSATAAVKIASGRDCRREMLAAIRFDMLCNQDEMFIGSNSVQPSELIDRLAEWETYMLEMPFLFHAQTIGTKKIALTSSMIIAVVHYRQRAGLGKANDFLRGFWGDADRPSYSPERKAMNYRLTTANFRGHSAITSIYRIFAWLLIAHYEKRRNPRLLEALDWGILRNKRTR